MFFINIYDKDHALLDEINEIGNVTYLHTLNGVNKLTFSIPLLSNKFTPKNFTELNHIELYENNKLKWFGVITNINFNDPSAEIGCMGYLHLLEKARLVKQNYYNKKYGDLIFDLLACCKQEVIAPGVKVQDDNIKTDRIIENTDMFLDKANNFIEEINAYIEVDKDRKLNFYNNLGKDKSYLTLQVSQEYSNILKVPTISKSTDTLANCIYAETTFSPTEEEVGIDGSTFVENTADVTLVSKMCNEESIAKYGLLEAVLSVNDIRLQDTLDKYVSAELEKVAFPSLNVSLEVIDSAVCPMDKVNVGDTITLWLEPYFNLKQKIRVVEIERNCTTNTYKITVGNILYRENKVVTKVYTY